MTLKTSSRKLNPFFGMIKSTVRKNFGIIVVLCIAALIYCPGSFIVNLQSLHKEVTRYGYTAATFTNSFGSIIKVFAPLLVLLLNFVNFSFLYKKSASDVFHAFPLTRTELLLSRAIGSIISALVPIVLATSCFITLGIFNPWLCDYGILFYDLAFSFVLIVLWSSFSLLFITCAGSTFDLILSFLGVNLGMIVIALIADNVFSTALLGYAYNSNKIYNVLSLSYFCAGVRGLEFWTKSISYIALFTSVSILLFNKRKAEKGGTAYAYKFMYYFCSVLASICGGYLIGASFDNDVLSIIFWFFMAAGAILFALIYGLITNRGFKGSGKSVLMGGIAIFVAISVTVISFSGGLGFSKRVPSEKMVKSVDVRVDGETITFTNPTSIVKLHEKVVEKSTEIDVYADDVTFYFDYKLKDGTTLERRFTVNTADFEDELLLIFKSEERFEMIKNETMLDKPQNQVEIRYPIGNGYRYSGYITQEQHQELLEIYWNDIQTLNYWQYSTSGHNLNFQIYTNDRFTNYFSLNISPYCYATIRYIEDITYFTYD